MTLAEYCRQHNLNPKSAGRWKNIFLHRSFDGLPGAAQQYLQADPLSGHMFVFFNRTFKIVNFLYWDGDGYAIWSKRLIRGMFHLSPDEYADPGNPLRGVVTAPAPLDPLGIEVGRTKFDVSFVVGTVVDKIENHLPLYRQIDECPVIHGDETPVNLLQPGQGKCKKGYMWLKMTAIGPQLVLFHFADSRSQEVAKELYDDYYLYAERRIARKNSTKPVAEFFDSGIKLQSTELPALPLGKALAYALNQREALEKFLHNPQINIDNNPAENVIRPIALGRKNWLFAGSEEGGQNLAVLASFAVDIVQFLSCCIENRGF